MSAESWRLDLPSGPVYDGPSAPPGLSRLSLPALAVKADAPEAVLDAALRAMRFYELDTAVLRAVDEELPPVPYLGPRGEHLGRVLGKLIEDRSSKERFDAYLAATVPSVLGMDERREGRYSSVEARFRSRDGEDEAVFLRESLSEGTLRAAGTLAALLPAADRSLIAIEEPETALHPARVGALYEALDDAAAHTQVIATSQSSDLLDNEYASVDHIRVVESVDGATRVGPVDAAGRTVIEKGLMSLAELHRSGLLRSESGSDTER